MHSYILTYMQTYRECIYIIYIYIYVYIYIYAFLGQGVEVVLLAGDLKEAPG